MHDGMDRTNSSEPQQTVAPPKSLDHKQPKATGEKMTRRVKAWEAKHSPTVESTHLERHLIDTEHQHRKSEGPALA